jgi:hypothetical protein
MQPRLCLLCRWTLQSTPDLGFYQELTIIVPRSACNTPDNISSDVYCLWQLTQIGEPVKSWLYETFRWMQQGHQGMSMYGPALPKLPDGRDLLTLPVLVTTLEHRIETAFCGYCVKPGDNVHSGCGCRVFLPHNTLFETVVPECFAMRTFDNSLYVDYTTRYHMNTGIGPWDVSAQEEPSV